MSDAIDLRSTTLDNGMRVIVNSDMTSPAVGVNIWYRVGSADETAGHFGFAHLFEHLMFSGTTSGIASGEHLATMESVGGTANATTSFDRTNYFESVPAGALELALWMESERLAHLAVTPENLATQREVVKEEKRQRYDNVPYGDLFDVLLGSQFGEGHPYGHSTIGSVPDLDAAALDDVVAFHEQWYRPDNACLVLSGCVPVDEGLRLADRYLGAVPIPSGPAPVPLAGAGLEDARPAEVIDLERDVPRTAVTLSWPSPSVTDPRQLSLEDGLTVLSTGMASRLVRRLVREVQLVEGVSASDLGLSRGRSASLLMAHLRPGVSVDRFREEVDGLLRGLAETGPGAEELARAHVQTERDWLLEMATVDSRADMINLYESVLGGAGKVNDYLDRVRAVTAEQVQAAAASWLDPGRASVIVHHRAQEESE